MAEVIAWDCGGREIELRLYLTWKNCWAAVARESRRLVTAVRGASREEVLERLRERLTVIFEAEAAEVAEAAGER